MDKRSILRAVQQKRLSPSDALEAIRRLSMREKPIRGKDIAIVGMSGTFPGANNIAEFWELLESGKDAISRIPESRWDSSAFYSNTSPEQTPPDKSYCDHGGFIDSVFSFDPAFFQISPKDAESMDPQERLFLQSCWHTFEDAGYTRERIQRENENSPIGVYLGETTNNYFLHGPEQWERNNRIMPTTLPWSMANRVSYFFNLSGPSLTIDTACSSSLVALHQAVEAIRNGQIGSAVVGGVNLYLHPSKYVWLSQMNMLSPSGKCHSFGEDADGFCPGEGIISILIKPLKDAVKAGDTIHGVIKGTAVNHDGKTTGFTVPNPQAQASLIKAALKDAECHPNDISFIEAHGTGTKLGDPIEIAGINTAFASRTIKSPCKVSSAKANIGHLEAAAGLAGLIKVLLQMKQKTLVPSINCETLNQNLDLSSKRISIAREKMSWPVSAIVSNTNRVAGLSSFGAGGVNAHAIIEEYSQEEIVLKSSVDPQLILFSAHSEEALTHLLQAYLNLIKSKDQRPNLEQLSLLTRVYKTALTFRVAIIASTIDELCSSIDSLLRTKEYHHVTSRRVTEKQARSADLRTLKNAWEKGTIDSVPLPDDPLGKPTISLPLYPFSLKEYRVVLREAEEKQIKSHPLLGENRSTIESFHFETTFTGDEFFLRDHCLWGKKTLPGVAYLEMAFQAHLLLTGKQIRCFKKVVWTTPYHFCQHDKTLRIEFTPKSEGMDFRVTSSYDDNEYVHATGSCYTNSERVTVSEFEVSQNEHSSHSFIYNRFCEKELTYGTTFRPIDSIDKTKHGFRAALTLSDTEDKESFFLHPSLLDGALQTTIAAFDNNDTMLPLEIGEMHIFGSVNQSTEVYTTQTSGHNGVNHFDCIIGETSPQIVIKDFVLKTVNYPSDIIADSTKSQVSYFTHEWIDSKIKPVDNPSAIIVCDTIGDSDKEEWFRLFSTTNFKDNFLNKFKKEYSDKPLTIILEHFLDSDFDKNNKELNVTNSLIRLINHVIEIQKVIEQPTELILFCRKDSPKHKAITGFLKTASEEFIHLRVSYITIKETNNKVLLSYLKEEVGHFFKMNRVRIEKGVRQVLHFKETLLQLDPESPIKKDKTYLITGGLGGLGVVFAKHILESGANVVIFGRTKKANGDDLVDSIFKELHHKVRFESVDLKDISQISGALKRLNDEGIKLSGVIHSAGITSDKNIFNKHIAVMQKLNDEKTPGTEEIRSVLNAKVCGTDNLDEVTRDEPLDFFVLFSSISSIVGNVGQCDYATANAYMNSFAQDRNHKVKQGTRRGRTLSILWPLWDGGGMRVSDDKKVFFKDKWGMIPLPQEDGIKAFVTMLSTKNTTFQDKRYCILPFYGEVKKLYAIFMKEHETLQKYTENEIDKDTNNQIIEILQYHCSEITGFDKEHITEYNSLDELGFDSIKITELTNILNREYNLDLSVALFFEFLTIGELSTHLAENYSKHFASKTSQQIEYEPPVREIIPSPVTEATQTPKEVHEGIAIVGMSGKFPGCESPSDLWDALKNKRDCITEVPRSRWNWRDFEEENLPRWGGFVNSIDRFDPHFFGIPPAEASVMDPQQRIVLETVWKAIEDSGHKASELENSKTGIYLGVSVNDYAELMEKKGTEIKAQSSIGSVHSMIANRVSYLLNLRGPSESIDTACSSSLVALHRAVQDIENGNAEMALVGGVNAILSPKLNRSFNKAGMLSPDGRCKPFDAAANGYVRSEGVGIIFLKPLKKAVADGDHIYAKIAGTHVNHGGKAKSLTAPNPKAQSELLLEAYEKANVPFSTISYLETHGTGTALGDPIEIHGLSNVAKKENSQEHHCVLGSVKANVGHLESAAGITGVIKVLLAMKHKTIPGTPHLKTMNPKIQLANTPYSFAEETTPWETDSLPRRAGISSFGFGGVNAHVVLEDVEQSHEKINSSEKLLFPFSAKSEESLRAIIKQYIQLLSQNSMATSESQLNRSQMIHITADALNLPESAIDLQLPPIDLGITKESATVIVQMVNKTMQHSFSAIDLIESPTLAEFCSLGSSNSSVETPSIEQIAYTLQVGREQFSHRVAVIAHNHATLWDELSGILQTLPFEQKSNKNVNETDIKVAVEKRDFQTLRKQWMEGATIPFEELYSNLSITRASLPTYEFNGKRYWFEQDNSTEDSTLLNRIEKVITTNTCYDGTFANNTTINDLHLDSLQVVSLFHALSSEFEHKIDLSTVSFDKSIESIVTEVSVNEKQSLGNINSTEKQFFEELYLESFQELDSYSIELKQTALNCNIEVLKTGNGDPILLLNGLGMTFAALHKVIKELSTDHTIYSINYPGTGLSDSLDKPIVEEEICQAIISILDSYNVTSFDVMGWSMGGFLAQHISEKYPNRVKTVTLINSSNYFEGDYAIDEVYQMLQLVDKTYLDQVKYYKVPNPDLYKKISVGTQNIKETFKAFEFVYNFNKSQRQFEITSPTLLLTNSDDPIISSKHSYAINNYLLNKGVTTMIKEIKHGSHYIPMFETEGLISIFRTFKKRSII